MADRALPEQAPIVEASPPTNEDAATTIEEPLPELEAENDDSDSAYGSIHGSDGGTSVTSSILQGYTYSGRKYQVTRTNDFNVPSDSPQFESMFAKHLCFRVLESLQPNQLFRSPIRQDAQHIIDLGTGDGAWALDVADAFPNVTVHGTDLYPPPNDWVAPNCVLEVDDMTKPWLWPFKFDLVHVRFMFGTIPRSEWRTLYRRAFDHIVPGGWIEHVECDITIRNNDTLKPAPPGSLLADFANVIFECAKKTGNATDITDWMSEEIREAGFVSLHERDIKMPIGDWPSHPIYKEAGGLAMTHFKGGLEGWCMWLLTKHGSPTPWSPEEVQVYLAKLRNELNQGYHIFESHKRVYAQKPLEEPKAEAKQPVLENVAETVKETLGLKK